MFNSLNTRSDWNTELGRACVCFLYLYHIFAVDSILADQRFQSIAMRYTFNWLISFFHHSISIWEGTSCKINHMGTGGETPGIFCDKNKTYESHRLRVGCRCQHIFLILSLNTLHVCVCVPRVPDWQTHKIHIIIISAYAAHRSARSTGLVLAYSRVRTT